MHKNIGQVRVCQAIGRLSMQYNHAEVLIEYAMTADGTTERNRSLRRAIGYKARGIVEHDRILNTRDTK